MRQAMQVVGQGAQGVAAQIEDFQRIRQLKDFLRELGQPTGQIQTFEPRQLTGAQFSEGIHKQAMCTRIDQ